MIFKEINNNHLHFDLEYRDDSELTGFIWQSEITRLGLYLSFSNSFTSSSILVTDVENLIQWFENLSLNQFVEPKVLIFDNQLFFDLLENNSNSKIIRVTYDRTVPITGGGAYSISPEAKKEDFFVKTSFNCEMDDLEIERIAKKLKAELQIELQIGFQVESKKPKQKT